MPELGRLCNARTVLDAEVCKKIFLHLVDCIMLELWEMLKSVKLVTLGDCI